VVLAYAAGKVVLPTLSEDTSQAQKRYAPSFMVNVSSNPTDVTKPYTVRSIAKFLGRQYPDGQPKEAIKFSLPVLELIEQEALEAKSLIDLNWTQVNDIVKQARLAKQQSLATAARARSRETAEQAIQVKQAENAQRQAEREIKDATKATQQAEQRAQAARAAALEHETKAKAQSTKAKKTYALNQAKTKRVQAKLEVQKAKDAAQQKHAAELAIKKLHAAQTKQAEAEATAKAKAETDARRQAAVAAAQALKARATKKPGKPRAPKTRTLPPLATALQLVAVILEYLKNAQALLTALEERDYNVTDALDLITQVRAAVPHVK